MTSKSSLPHASKPLLLKAINSTADLESFSVLNWAHVLVFQSITFVSLEPLASKPLLSKATENTSFVWPSKVLISAPVSAFQIFIF